MAVRQYVGARYVPKFADPVVWQSGMSYEALTIVTYNNSSYTSKLSVPATVGNPADNDTYWALTGNYNAQVEAYREITENLQSEFNNLTTPITIKKIGIPELYGATGNGTNDDTSAVQNCVNDNDVTLLISDYLITSTINITTNKAIIGTPKCSITSNTDIVIFNATNTQYVSIIGVTIHKPCGNNYAIVMSGVKPTVKKCRILSNLTDAESPISGIHIQGVTTSMDSFEADIEDNFITVGQIVIEGNTDGYVLNNVVWGSSIGITANSYTVEVLSNSYNIIGNQIVPGSKGGLHVKSTGGASMFDVSSNYFDGSYSTVHGGSLLTIENVPQCITVTNNKFYNSFTNAITIISCEYYIISHNYFIGSNKGGDSTRAEIDISEQTYGNRATITENNFNLYGTSIPLISVHSNDYIVFSNNLINGNYSTELYGYAITKGIVPINNLYNGAYYVVVSGIVSELSNGNFGIACHVPNYDKISVSYQEANGERKSVYSFATVGNGGVVQRGDNEDLNKPAIFVLRCEQTAAS